MKLVLYSSLIFALLGLFSCSEEDDQVQPVEVTVVNPENPNGERLRKKYRIDKVVVNSVGQNSIYVNEGVFSCMFLNETNTIFSKFLIFFSTDNLPFERNIAMPADSSELRVFVEASGGTAFINTPANPVATFRPWEYLSSDSSFSYNVSVSGNDAFDMIISGIEITVFE